MESSWRVRLLTIRNWVFIAVSVLASIKAGMASGDLLAASDAALEGILSVFSILAGVLVAVISIIGDPSMLLTGNWRLGYVHAEQIQIRLARYAHVIFIYFLVLILVLVCMVIKDSKITGLDFTFQVLTGLTVFALLVSLPIPYGLMSIQRERMAEEVKRRKATPQG
jgi:ABC-type multidrug transport system fused ATPase/permease subunit